MWVPACAISVLRTRLAIPLTLARRLEKRPGRTVGIIRPERVGRRIVYANHSVGVDLCRQSLLLGVLQKVRCHRGILIRTLGSKVGPVVPEMARQRASVTPRVRRIQREATTLRVQRPRPWGPEAPHRR